MNILVLSPESRILSYALCSYPQRRLELNGKMENYLAMDGGRNAINSIAQSIRGAGITPPGGIGIRAVYGGEDFGEMVMADASVIKKIEEMTPAAPLHVPPLLACVLACQNVFARTPIVLFFETGFSAGMPAWESAYALDRTVVGHRPLRRYSFHGIFHEAACDYARDLLPHPNTARIISICMDIKSEVAAVIGTRPVMITGGSTPMEGLPGDRICGDIDPEIPLILAKKMGWGGEKINNVLSQESGLYGLTGEKVTLENVLDSGDGAYGLAHDVMVHKIIIACGAAVAAMGGLDAIVFSGRYAGTGLYIERALSERLKRGCPGLKGEIVFLYNNRPLREIIAERVVCRLGQAVACPAPQCA